MGGPEDLLLVVQARLKQAALGNMSYVLEPTALAEAQELAKFAGDLRVAVPLGWLHWYRSQALPEAQGRQDLDAAISVLTPCYLAGADNLPESLLPDLAKGAVSAAALMSLMAHRTGDPTLIATAVKSWQRIVSDTPADHPDRGAYLSSLGAALQVRFNLTGAMADLDAAIRNLTAGLAATSAGYPDRGKDLSNLGNALRARFERDGAPDDLDGAIKAGTAALTLAPPGDPDRAGRLSNLGAALQFQFDRTGVRADLDAGVKDLLEAVGVTSADDPDRPSYLSNLANGLLRRFERTGALDDLNAAVENAQAAVDATPANHPDRAGRLSNLGIAQRTRFERTGALDDLNAAVENGQAAVDATPANHPDQAAGLQANVGNALHARFGHTGASADLDAAIGKYLAAIDATPTGHPNRAGYLFDLGGALQDRFLRTQTEADRDTALAAYADAAGADSSPPSVRIHAARKAASLVARSDPGRAADLLEKALRLLGEVAPRQLERHDQQYAIGGFAGLAGDAAALALAEPSPADSQRAARALRLLEAGRAVLLSQALDTRSDLTELRNQRPDLAVRFVELRDHLDRPAGESDPVSALTSGRSSAVAPPGQAAEDRRRLATEFNEVLEQIRAVEGFASFGLPPTAGELLAEARLGPVITFNVSAYRSDALLLTGDGIASLELPGLAYGALTEQINSFHRALNARADPSAGRTDRRAAEGKLLDILGWLWDSAAGPVMDALGYRQPPRPGATWPRVWWAPGGLLGLLPIHAAGHHTDPSDGGQPRRTVVDRVISSWIPTIRALGYARQHAERTTASVERTLIVAMPVTPGLRDGGALPNVPVEVARVRSLLSDTILLAEPTASGQPMHDSVGIPTRQNVLAQLSACPIAHFACHGFSDPTDPSRSMLFLHDHDQHPLTVASLGPVDLDHAQLAYLSSCQTAFTSTAELIDEAIHLTTAFQLAGFPHVIGTLWKTDDRAAVHIADAFYTVLRTSSHGLDTSYAARALHDAVRAEREDFPGTPSLWAGYVHAGS